MSIKRLTKSERVTYLLGLAARRQIEQAPKDPDTLREIEAFMRWAEHWLTPDELLAIGEETGWAIGDLLNEDADGQLIGDNPAPKVPPDPSAAPDDIPF